MKKYSIGLDIGTTSAKAVLFHKDGSVVAEHEAGYSVFHPQPSWSEQDPIIIEHAAINAIHHVMTKSSINHEELAAIGLSSAMHSLICVNEKNEPLSHSITWADQRSIKQAEALQSNDGVNIYLRTGTPLHPMSPLAKLIWMKESNYEPYKYAAKFLSIKEFLVARWFGEHVVDYSIASATGLFNIRTLTWDDTALNLAGVDKEQLSKPVSPMFICQGLSPNLAQAMAVPSDLPFVMGGSDGALANIGIGAISPGDVAITIGTSGAIRQMSSSPYTDKNQEVFCYSVSEDLWVMGGPTNNGGNVFQWLKEVLGEKEVINEHKGKSAYQLLTELAQTSQSGANGLLFLPYLNGERAPLWNAEARGSFLGLNQSHTKADLIRAGLEGTIFSLFHVSEALGRLAGSPNHIFASGGFARSRLWLQIVADVFGMNIQVPESHQSSAWGAAWFGLLATGEVTSLNDIKHSIPMREEIQPNTKSHNTYQELFTIYKEASLQLTPTFSKLAKFQLS